ncbi:transcobalamin-2 [Discoglossus pictus]
MAPIWPVLIILLQYFNAPVKSCEIPEGNRLLIQSLNIKLLRSTLDVSREPNPSVYVGLRLSEDHSLQRENEYLEKLKTSLQDITSSTKGQNQEEPSTGILALHVLAMKASCEDMNTPERNKLITRLKRQLHAEKTNIVAKENPLSNYYQYSLGILAMCVNDKKVDTHVIQKLLQAEMNNKFVHGDTVSIDTEAMAGLSFLCLKRSKLYPHDLNVQIRNSILNVKQKIVVSKNTEGSLGNIYSTPLAVQFLSALGTSKDEKECSTAIDTLLEAMKQGKFSNPMMMSQLMPVLHHKSYLDVAKISCTDNKDNLFLSPSSGLLPEVAVGENTISVLFTVEGPSDMVQPFTQVIDIQSQSSILDILKTARKENSNLMFETKDSLYGPYLTAINGVQTSVEKRTYWQLLKHPNTSLIEGIADYRPEDGEHLIFRLSSW